MPEIRVTLSQNTAMRVSAVPSSEPRSVRVATQGQSGFDLTAVLALISDAYGVANTANARGNLAQMSSNSAYDFANTINTVARAAYDKANSANLFAYAANTIPVANTQSNGYVTIRSSVRTTLNFIPGQDITIGVTDDSAGDRANITISAVPVGPAWDAANAVFGVANVHNGAILAANTIAIAAFGRVNVVSAVANTANDRANLAQMASNAAYDFANTINIKVDSAFGVANNANLYANLAFRAANAAYDFANTINIKVDAAFGVANVANARANLAQMASNAAYDFANTINIKVDAAFGVANNANVYANLAFRAANAAYDFANTINIKVDAAFGVANVANARANLAQMASNAAYDFANSINSIARSAFDQANSSNLIITGNTMSNGYYATRSSRRRLNFVPASSNVRIEINDDSAGDRVNVVIETFGTGGGSGTGANLTAANVLSNSKIIVRTAAYANINFIPDTLMDWDVTDDSTHFAINVAARSSSAPFAQANAAYSKANAPVYVSDSPPASPVANSLWWQSNTGVMYIYYNDGSSSQWVEATGTALISAAANAAFAKANLANTLTVGNTLSNGFFIVRSSQRSRLNFVPASANLRINVTDDSAGDRINVEIETFGSGGGGTGQNLSIANALANGYFNWQSPAYANLVFKDDALLTWNVANDATNYRVNVYAIPSRAPFDVANTANDRANLAQMASNAAFALANTLQTNKYDKTGGPITGNVAIRQERIIVPSNVALDITADWANTGQTFVMLRANIANIDNAHANSLFIQLQANNVTKFNITTQGNVYANGASFAGVVTPILNSESGNIVSTTGHRFQGAVSESIAAMDRVDIGTTAGTPRIVFENSGQQIWQIDVENSAFRYYIPGTEAVAYKQISSVFYMLMGATAGRYGWSASAASPSTGSVDTAIGRPTAGNVAIFNGTANYANLLASNITAGNTVSAIDGRFTTQVLTPYVACTSTVTVESTSGDLQLGGASAIKLSTASLTRWRIDSSGNFYPETDSSWDIGSPTNRPKAVWVAGNVTTGNIILTQPRVTYNANIAFDITADWANTAQTFTLIRANIANVLNAQSTSKFIDFQQNGVTVFAVSANGNVLANTVNAGTAIISGLNIVPAIVGAFAQSNIAMLTSSSAYDKANAANILANQLSAVAQTQSNGYSFVQSTRGTINFVPGTDDVKITVVDDSTRGMANVTIAVPGVGAAYAAANGANGLYVGNTYSNTYYETKSSGRTRLNFKAASANVRVTVEDDVSGDRANVIIESFGGSGGGGLTAVVQDTNPSLGGDLNINGKNVFGTGNVDVVGTINSTKNVAIRQVRTTVDNVALDITTDWANTAQTFTMLRMNAANIVNAGPLSKFIDIQQNGVSVFVVSANGNVLANTVNAGTAIISGLNIVPAIVGAFAQSNIAMLTVSSAYDRINVVSGVANTANDRGNLAQMAANGAFAQSNIAMLTSSSAYDKANLANQLANGAFLQANVANTYTVGNTKPDGSFTIRTSTRSVLNFVNTGGTLVEVYDDSTNQRANVVVHANVYLDGAPKLRATLDGNSQEITSVIRYGGTHAALNTIAIQGATSNLYANAGMMNLTTPQAIVANGAYLRVNTGNVHVYDTPSIETWQLWSNSAVAYNAFSINVKTAQDGGTFFRVMDDGATVSRIMQETGGRYQLEVSGNVNANIVNADFALIVQRTNVMPMLLGAFAQSNIAMLTSSSAYDKANLANQLANGAFLQANVANTYTVGNTKPDGSFTIRTSTRSVLNFVNTGGTLVEVYDDSTNGRANVLLHANVYLDGAPKLRADLDGNQLNIASVIYANSKFVTATESVTTGNIRLAQPRVTYNANIAFDITADWANTAQTFTLIRANIANTLNAGSTSKFIDFQQNGVSVFVVSANGNVLANTVNADWGLIVARLNVKPAIESAFAQSNIAMLTVSSAYDRINVVSGVANVANDRANLAQMASNAAYDFANVINSIARSAFAQSNIALLTASSGYDKANAANILANQVSAVAQTYSNGYVIQMSTRGTLNFMADTTDLKIQVQDNATHGLVNVRFDAPGIGAAYAQANFAMLTVSSAYDRVNVVSGVANVANDRANLAQMASNAAFAVANAALPNTSGVTFAGDLKIPTMLYSNVTGNVVNILSLGVGTNTGYLRVNTGNVHYYVTPSFEAWQLWSNSALSYNAAVINVKTAQDGGNFLRILDDGLTVFNVSQDATTGRYTVDSTGNVTANILVGSFGAIIGQKNALPYMVAAFDLANTHNGAILASNTIAIAAFTQANAPVYVSDAAPGTPIANSLWFKSDTGALFLRYNDGSSSQWVEVGGLGDGEQPRQEVLVFAIGDETTSLTAGTNKTTMYFSKEFIVQNVYAALSGNGSSGNTHVDINKNGASIFTTNITIMPANAHSRFGGAQPVLTASTITFNENDKMNVDVDLASTGATGLKVHLIGYYAN